MDYSKVLGIMEREGKKNGAAVYKIGALAGKNPFKNLVFVMLSARTTDVRTYNVCKALFAKADTPRKILKMDKAGLEKILHPIGFYRAKTQKLIGLSEKIVNEFGGKVPKTREELMSLPGVGRKTANIVLNTAFGEGTIGVDVHVHKIANRLGWVKTKTPLETEKALVKLLPKGLLRKCNIVFVGYGQTICTTRSPKCKECKVRKYCKRVGLNAFPG